LVGIEAFNEVGRRKRPTIGPVCCLEGLLLGWRKDLATWFVGGGGEDFGFSHIEVDAKWGSEGL
jgi:hypothetical protein